MLLQRLTFDSGMHGIVKQAGTVFDVFEQQVTQIQDMYLLFSGSRIAKSFLLHPSLESPTFLVLFSLAGQHSVLRPFYSDMTQHGQDTDNLTAQMKGFSLRDVATKSKAEDVNLDAATKTEAADVHLPGWNVVEKDDTLKKFMVNVDKFSKDTDVDMLTPEEAENVYKAVEQKRKLLGTPEIDPRDAIWHGEFADLDLSKMSVNTDTNEVEAKRLRRQDEFNAGWVLEKLKQDLTDA